MARDAVGVEDRWPVVAEPFRQWVIEDEFANGRPRWEDVGVLFTDRVHDWEIYKLRLLNAGHSSMAYLAALAGVTYVDEAMALPEVRSFLHRLLHDEAVPSLVPIPGHPPGGYVASVLERFANTGVRDQIARLCIDGSAKFPTFLLPTITFQLDHDGPIGDGALALAGWARYLATVPPERQAFDAAGDTARRHARRAMDEPTRFLDFAEVFPTRCATAPGSGPRSPPRGSVSAMWAHSSRWGTRWERDSTLAVSLRTVQPDDDDRWREHR